MLSVKRLLDRLSVLTYRGHVARLRSRQESGLRRLGELWDFVVDGHQEGVLGTTWQVGRDLTQKNA